MKKQTPTFIIAMIATLFLSAIQLNAQDWPQWRGANQNGIYNEADLNLDWASKLPKLLWTFRQAGTGYSSPTVVGKTLYCQGADKGNDFAFALNTETGSLIWRQDLGEQYVQDRGDGPRGSITVNGDKLYLIRGAGQIHCLSAEDGKMIWQRDFINDFGGKLMSQWGYSESPLVDNNLVICTPGGEKGTVIALDKNSGAIVWVCNEWTDEAGYSSPIVAVVDGVRQYIQQSNKGVAGVSAKDGQLLWRVEAEGYRVAIIPTPIYHNNIVYVTAGYNSGCTAIKLTKKGDIFNTEIVYANKNMQNHHGGVALLNDHIYGYSENSGWTCQNFNTGEVVWLTGRSGVVGVTKGAVLVVNDRLLILEEKSGTMVIADTSTKGWKEWCRMEMPERTEMETKDNMVWAHPVVANGKLYIRDHDLLFCFDLKK